MKGSKVLQKTLVICAIIGFLSMPINSALNVKNINQDSFSLDENLKEVANITKLNDEDAIASEDSCELYLGDPNLPDCSLSIGSLSDSEMKSLLLKLNKIKEKYETDIEQGDKLSQYLALIGSLYVLKEYHLISEEAIEFLPDNEEFLESEDFDVTDFLNISTHCDLNAFALIGTLSFLSTTTFVPFINIYDGGDLGAPEFLVEFVKESIDFFFPDVDGNVTIPFVIHGVGYRTTPPSLTLHAPLLFPQNTRFFISSFGGMEIISPVISFYIFYNDSNGMQVPLFELSFNFNVAHYLIFTMYKLENPGPIN